MSRCRTCSASFAHRRGRTDARPPGVERDVFCVMRSKYLAEYAVVGIRAASLLSRGAEVKLCRIAHRVLIESSLPRY